MNIRFLEPARKELEDAVDWYEAEQKGLGRLFLTDIHSALKRVGAFPDSCTMIAPGLRRCLTKRFPYMLVYGIDDGTVIVVAVAHLHRMPLYWQGRL